MLLEVVSQRAARAVRHRDGFATWAWNHDLVTQDDDDEAGTSRSESVRREMLEPSRAAGRMLEASRFEDASVLIEMRCASRDHGKAKANQKPSYWPAASRAAQQGKPCFADVRMRQDASRGKPRPQLQLIGPNLTKFGPKL